MEHTFGITVPVPMEIVDSNPVDVNPVDIKSVDLYPVFKQAWRMNKKAKEPDALELLAKNVETLRLAKGLSQEKLGEWAGLHRTYISQVERQVANPSVKNLQKIADVLQVSVARLFEAPSCP